MTKFERDAAHKVADSAIAQALRHFAEAKHPLRDSQVLLATASSAMLAQQNGSLGHWLSVCIAIAEKLSQSFAEMQNCIADAQTSARNEQCIVSMK